MYIYIYIYVYTYISLSKYIYIYIYISCRGRRRVRRTGGASEMRVRPISARRILDSKGWNPEEFESFVLDEALILRGETRRSFGDANTAKLRTKDSGFQRSEVHN